MINILENEVKYIVIYVMKEADLVKTWNGP
jgi:hypothetical protein